jgi:HTH-type transcriptional repressor of NAD biosynthesis genes
VTDFSQGLIIGKFYPPHLGHIGLIERSAARCDHLAVLVMASDQESLSLADRVEWTRAAIAHLPGVTVLGIMDEAPVDYDSDIAWVAHHASMNAALRHAGIHRVDAVFSSEPYGVELASRFAAVAVIDDVERIIVPMSGTAARSDLVAAWPLLPESTQRGLATRIIVVGAESTGTTTLTKALVEHYRAMFPAIATVEEYGRYFTYELFDEARAEALRLGHAEPTMDDLVWTADHFVRIATRQTELENAAALASPLVIADTDAFATELWERRYRGADSRGARDAAVPDLPRRDLYLVTDHEGVLFEQDGWRDGEHIRAEMTAWFIDELTARGHSWVLLRGPHERRLDYAIKTIQPLLDRRLHFAATS